MPPPRDIDLLVKVARLYFEDRASQQEIAERVGVSRSNVSRMLASARERGIVEVRINDPAGRDVDLEKQLREVFGLIDARVSAGGPTSTALQRAGSLAATWLVTAVRDAETLGLSWGTTLQAVVAELQEQDTASGLEVVPLVGGLSSVHSSATGQELVRQFAEALGAGYRYLHAPALLRSAEAAAALRQESSIREALAVARSVDVALVGIGNVSYGSSAALLADLDLDEQQLAEFSAQEPVGDICARFFDRDGRPVTAAVEDRVIAITLDELRRIPLVAGVACGTAKAHGTLGALRGGLVDVLICDSPLATRLLLMQSRDAREHHPRSGDLVGPGRNHTGTA